MQNLNSSRVIGGGTKVAYDLALYRAVPKLGPPEMGRARYQLTLINGTQLSKTLQ